MAEQRPYIGIDLSAPGFPPLRVLPVFYTAERWDNLLQTEIVSEIVLTRQPDGSYA